MILNSNILTTISTIQHSLTISKKIVIIFPLPENHINTNKINPVENPSELVEIPHFPA